MRYGCCHGSVHLLSTRVPFKTMLEIRTARVDDKISIQKIYVSAVGVRAGSDEAQWNQLIQAGGLLIVHDAGRIIGFGGIDVKAREQVRWLYLLPQYQGAGIGSQLLQRLEEVGWKAGLNLLRLHSAPAAIEFYRRHGYKAVEPSELIGHDHDGLEMVKGPPKQEN
jgi:GNAT superfamily N-acetyltransferase